MNLCAVAWCPRERASRFKQVCRLHARREYLHGHPLWKTVECPRCGSEHKVDLDHGNRKLCNGCRYSSCENCGRIVVTLLKNHRGRFCSLQCAGEAKRTNISNCRVCDVEFWHRNNKNQKYCSHECAQKDYKHWWRPGTATCEDCGEEFQARGFRHLYCDKCQPERYAQWGREHTNRRRALKRGASLGEVDREAIFERDGWTCQICYEPIDRRTKWPHPKFGTLDHIVPLSDGGDHAEYNLQAAHALCNWRKREGSAGSQMLLRLSA